MPTHLVETDDSYLLNYCTKHLARITGKPSESWRFPIVDSYAEPGLSAEECASWNTVTFVYSGPEERVELLGTFAPLYERFPLRPVRFEGEPTPFRALSVRIPRGEAHLYRFAIDGQMRMDPINPQRAKRPDDRTEWSRFFTMGASQPLTLERWEYVLLDRLCDHILPFRTDLGENFLERFYFYLSKQQQEELFRHAYRLENSVGIVNFIDKLLAREEQHRLVDYRICLKLIDQVLRQRMPNLDPEQMPRNVYVELYNQMGEGEIGNVPGWDYQQYGNPKFFLKLLRRHAYTGAFSHPKYGGNSAGAAWAYLSERYSANGSGTLFDWRQAIEKPLGTSEVYRG